MNGKMTAFLTRTLLPCKIGALFLLMIGVVTPLHAMMKSDELLTAEERAWIAHHPVIRLAPDPDFAPIEYFDEYGTYSGISRDYVSLLEKKLGIHIEIVRLRDWNEIISKAKSREIDLFVAGRTPQRAEYMLFTKPFLEFPVVIIARETRETLQKTMALEDLGGMRVSVVSQYATHDLIRNGNPKLHLDAVPDVKTGLRKVSFGLTDVFVEGLANATYCMEREGIANLRIAGETGYSYHLGFCSRKDWPELNRILEKGLVAIGADEKKAIYKKWVPFESESLLYDKAFQRRITAGLVAVAVIFACVIVWNRILARQVTVRTGELEKELCERRKAEAELELVREELEKKVAERTEALQNANELLEREIAVSVGTENVNLARLRLLQFSAEHTLDELLESTLDEAEALTGSVMGFYHFLEEDQQTLSLQNWSSRTKAEFCSAQGKGRHYNTADAGVWIDCVRERRPVIHNDYEALPHRKGLPPGHVPVAREAVVPVFRGDKIVAVLGVGNKAAPYTAEDVETVSLLADLAWEITERKRIEEALLFSQYCIDKACVGIFETNETGVILGVNEHACTKLGYSKSEMMAMTVFDFDPEVTPEKMLEIRKALEADGHVTFETSHRHRDGTVFPVEITANLLDYHGKEFGICFVKDVTDAKRARDELMLTQLSVDEASIGIVRISNDGSIVCTNKIFCRTLGYTAEELSSMTVFDLDPTMDREKFVEHRKATKAVGSRCFETLHRHKDGSVYPVEVTVNCLRYNGEDVTVSFVKDISERKQVEEALRESQAKYQAIVDSFDGLIYVCSEELRIQFMNRKLIERVGYDAVGEPCHKVVHDRDQQCPWCVNDQVFAGQSVHWDMYSPRDRCWYDVLNVPIRHADGSMSKHAMMIDITDRKLAEQELKAQKQLLQELNETLERRVAEEVAKNRDKDIMLIQQNRQAALGEMLDHIAHQWKQPLNSIALLLGLLGESGDRAADTEFNDTVDKIHSILQHMAQTVDVFRDFYRPDKEKKFFRLKDSIDQALAFIAPAYRFHAITVEVDVDAGLTAYGYPKEYTQVLLNVLANARDVFRARKTKHPRVVVRALAEDSQTVVTIEDNAGGIPEEVMERIFDFYFTTNESGSGTGIGLYMSKNIIEKNMGGRLSARNNSEGALFEIAVPAA